MAMQQVIRVTCDRCKGLAQEISGSEAPTFDQRTVQIVTTLGGVEDVQLRDLCAKCKTRVTALIKMIRLDKDDMETKAPADSSVEAAAIPNDKTPEVGDTGDSKAGKTGSKQTSKKPTEERHG